MKKLLFPIGLLFTFPAVAHAQCYNVNAAGQSTVHEQELCTFAVPDQKNTCVTNPYLDPCEVKAACKTNSYDYYMKFHPGTDCRAYGNQKVMSPVNGVITKTYVRSTKKWVGPHEDKWGTVVIDTGGENYMLVLHMSESYVKLGDKVQVGCVLGRSGSKGTIQEHVHFESKKYLSYPADYMRKTSDAQSELLKNPGSNWGPVNKLPKKRWGFKCKN